MIISIAAIDTESNKKIFRSTRGLSSSKINYYITEFLGNMLQQEGVLQKETYNYVYLTSGPFRYFIQTTKDSEYGETMALLRYIEQNSEYDVYDILITIDSLLYGCQGIKIDLQPIKSMDSQEEKIYNMMVENKNMEIRQREKAYKKAEFNEQVGIQYAPPVEIRPKKVEKSEKPVLVVIKEKIKVAVDVENYIKENVINGEINMIISDARYQNIQLKMKNLKGALKFSPYLDKSTLKKGILRFEKDRGLNKTIPLLKWTGKSTQIPLSFDYWNDEEDGKYLSILEFKALRDLDDLELRFNKDDITEAEVGDGVLVQSHAVTWSVGSVKKGESRTTEIRYFGFDNKGLFPVEVSFRGSSIETPIDLEEATADGRPVDLFEVRKILEVEMFKIVNE